MLQISRPLFDRIQFSFINGFLLFAFALFLSIPAKGENKATIDSLLLKLSASTTDSARFRCTIELISNHLYYIPDEGLKYAPEAIRLATKLKRPNLIAFAYSSIGSLYWRLGQFDKALHYHYRSLEIYKALNKPEQIVMVMIQIGHDYADAGKYDLAKKILFETLALPADSTIASSMIEANMLLAWVYSNEGDFTKEAKLNLETLKMYEQTGDQYGAAIAKLNIGDSYRKLHNYPKAITYTLQAIKYLKENNLDLNLVGAYNQLANIYKDSGNMSIAKKYYQHALQLASSLNEITSIAETRLGMGELLYLERNYQDALIEFRIAGDAFDAISNKLLSGLAHTKQGICYLELKQLEKAKLHFEEARKLAGELNNQLIFVDLLKGMEKLDSSTGNWHNAYFNFKHYILLRDSLYNLDRFNETAQFQNNFEQEKKEALARAEQEIKDIRQRTIRNSIAAGLAVSLVFLIVVYRQRNRIAMEKKRSDDLLLNILPEETAEELKSKGSADAKQYDEVTVMFTDFKGFTTISERLTPAQLVEEIDTCFKAFDTIISRHHIEKIKTIGDSYMCAGGLPVSNSTHAKDVLLAALEINDYMQQHLEERRKDGKELFEIRIGIHTGPVVAGIVGIKKFAYDIWGDTVNIASRMESSGEAGKVNISGNTYVHVKEDFNCTYRGKVQAKNKGEIDMYFVTRKTAPVAESVVS